MDDPDHPIWGDRDIFRPIFTAIPATLKTLVLELHKYSAFVTASLVVPPCVEVPHLVPIMRKADAVSIASRVPATIKSLKLACRISLELVEQLAGRPKPNLEMLGLNGIHGADAALVAAMSRLLHPWVRQLILTFARGGKNRNVQS
ncbi:hypothetical protein AMAG_00131 [Allomyces macrogynus ATCC 38327]|uniref:Uncharacterized protein n=1 Tax=Allomyces macrogynus (strain ATCC 38327) TaxID=578462 RepID=A0A0L0RVL6_ALLM3|nr:hypothetical protein AMAG_00131 [Allomyces macrogynus ATCC 38327]|eukprot:KNE54130.1 hypothetical protein AMAG_00131 [Allomyces macrogynus ATCC 38327]